MKTLVQDFRFGLRLLRTSPGFTVIAILTLALGIATNSTVFSWIDVTLLRPFPGARDAGRLAVLEMVTPGAPNGATQVSWMDYLDYRAGMRSLSGLAVHREDVFSIGSGAGTQAVWGELVSGNYFDVLGLKAEQGRLFGAEEDKGIRGANPVVVISDRLWRTRFNGNRKVVGSRLRVNRMDLTVVGVTPRGFGGTMPGLAFDVWVPVTMGPQLGLLDEGSFRHRGTRNLYALARLAAGVSREQARAEAAQFASRLAKAYPATNQRRTATVLPIWQFHSGAPDLLLKPLRILMAVSLVVLLIVCANVANLLLARSLARSREFAIRLALGAGRLRLLRQLLTETLTLALAAAAIGLPLSFWMADYLGEMVPKIGVTVATGLRVSPRLFGFTLLICAVSAVLSGVAPALFAFRGGFGETLKEGGRSGTASVGSSRTRSALVAAEVALALIALVGAGLFMRSFERARSIDPGFHTKDVVLARFYLGATGYSAEQVQRFAMRLADRLRPAPGVTGVTYSDFAPLGSSAGPYTDVQVEGYVPARGEGMSVNRYLVAPGYFEMMGTPLVEGREFLPTDTGEAPAVVVVNESFVRKYFGGRAAIGRRVKCWGKQATVVGVVKDSKYFDVAESPRPHFFAPFLQRFGAGLQLYFFVRSARDPDVVAASLRREVATIDPSAGAFHAMPLTEWTGVTLLPQKVAASMLAALGVIALVLAGVGLYSVMAYAVAQRTHEIGIRMALGAEPGRVLRNVLIKGMATTLAGVAAGALGALAAARLVASMLVDTSASDPVSFAGAALFLMAVALLASYFPARRATKVNPAVAFRSN